ncbi:AimR family lysis-lysogeny pheromone receptor [Rossellomorea sp. BNER]|uniref:AimR family lysis-lysogeny pheromone receptor n=1 Tax=Rossellomorea sp. BNER TaxID=2962031 RepID=UPI003AF1F4E1|nr:AimR family lysis-lysogeny pheromone receptor [Rossellomorea sp. BNER]
MKVIMSEIKKEMEKQGIKQKVIGPEIGSKNLSNNLSGKEQMAFIPFVKLVNLIFKEEEGLILNYIKRFLDKTTRDENIRVALEWSIQTGHTDMLRTAIKKCKQIKGSAKNEKKKERDSKNETHKQLAKIYELFIKRNELNVERVDFFFKLEEIRNSTISRIEPEVLLKIGRLHYYSESGNYRGILDEVRFIETGNVTQNYLKDSFTLRVLEQKARALLKYENDYKGANDVLKEILTYDRDLYAFSIINALSLLAELNTLDNYDLANKYIVEAIRLSSKIKSSSSYARQERMLKSTHDFIQLYHGRFNNLYLTDPAENIFYLIKKGDKESFQEAIKLLNELELTNGILSPFQLYYKAIATGEKRYLIESQREFHRLGDFYYSRIPSSML